MEPVSVPSALPGAMLFVVLLAAAATYPLSWAILAVYGRAVRRSMRKHSQAETPPEAGRRAIAMAPADVFAAVAVPALTDDAAGLAREMRRRPWKAARAYALAGIAYAAAMTFVILTATASWGGPIRFAVMTAVFAWPVLLTAGIVAAPRAVRASPWARRTLVGVFVLGAVGVAGNPEGSVFGALLLWRSQQWAGHDPAAGVPVAAHPRSRATRIGISPAGGDRREPNPRRRSVLSSDRFEPWRRRSSTWASARPGRFWRLRAQAHFCSPSSDGERWSDPPPL